MTNDVVSSKWIKLPDLKPSQIKASRSIRVQFSGDLERKIYTNPFFYGQEKNYLRAQIARIAHSTAVFPHCMWKVNEDNDREIEENTNADGEAIGFPKVNQLASAKEWGHATNNIL